MKITKRMKSAPGHNFSINSWGMTWFAWHHSKGLFWFRIFGYGLKGKKMNVFELMFSERDNPSNGLFLGKWWIGILKKGRI